MSVSICSVATLQETHRQAYNNFWKASFNDDPRLWNLLGHICLLVGHPGITSSDILVNCGDSVVAQNIRLWSPIQTGFQDTSGLFSKYMSAMNSDLGLPGASPGARGQHFQKWLGYTAMRRDNFTSFQQGAYWSCVMLFDLLATRYTGIKCRLDPDPNRTFDMSLYRQPTLIESIRDRQDRILNLVAQDPQYIEIGLKCARPSLDSHNTNGLLYYPEISDSFDFLVELKH